MTYSRVTSLPQSIPDQSL